MITGNFPNLRLRRSRKNDWSRRLIAENNLTPNDFILPLFLIDGKNKKQSINSMPGVHRYSLDKLSSVVDKALKLKLPMIALFPYTNKKDKDRFGTEALNEENLVCKATSFIKKKYGNKIGIMCDVALDPYTSHGHDGILEKNIILNDETIDILIKQSILQAEMGCDVLAPSDMMDGRIGKIRKALDKNGFKNTLLLSYAAKYASNYYGPFRDAIGSGTRLIGDKKTYQMDYNNKHEAIREVALDIKEGADMVMIKPGLPYLDVIKLVKNNFKVPVLAYQVSGEYSMIKNAINKKYVNKKIIVETLTSFKRAGASAVVTYFAEDVAKEL